MVSRRSDDSFVSRFAHGTHVLFQTWRALLTDGIGATARAGRATSAGIRRALSPPATVLSLLARTGRTACAPVDHKDARSATWIGFLALLVGATAAVAVSLSRASGPSDLASAIVVVLWAPGRYAVMRLAAEPQTDGERTGVAVAWGLGLLPFAFGLWPLGRTVAWAASALIVYRSLRCDFGARDTRWIWGWAFGIEAAAALAVWLLRNLHVAALFLGR